MAAFLSCDIIWDAHTRTHMPAHVHNQPFRAERPASSMGGGGEVDVPILDKEAVFFFILHKEKEVLTSLRSSETHR